MKRFFLNLVLLVAAWPAHAEYTIKTDECAPLPRHEPAPDVTYQPGIDSHGWAVEPADLYPPTVSPEQFEKVEVPLELPVKQYLKTDKYNFDFSESQIQVGTLEVDKDRVSLNGQDLEGEGEEYYSRECEKSGK